MNEINLTILLKRSVIDVMRCKQVLSVLLASACMILLFIDPDTAISGASEGIDQCFRVIVPSLFPCFFMSIYLNAQLLGLRIPVIHSLAKLLGIPKGGDSLLLLGMIGGYPVGAQAIASSYQRGAISRRCGQILLGYCSNGGPAFIFGVASFLFQSWYIPWALWLVQLIAILITGFLLPRSHENATIQSSTICITPVTALERSIRNLTSVCGWIILFKVLLAYISAIPFLTQNPSIAFGLSGVFELSNGCLNLSSVASESVRFVLCSVFLAFGGICVLMQTKSAVGPLGLGYYVPGKIMQTTVSYILSVILSFLLIPDADIYCKRLLLPLPLGICILLITLKTCKNSCGNERNFDI